MRARLLLRPDIVCERLAERVKQRRRLRKLRNTPAQHLTLSHIDSLELLEIARDCGIRVIYDIGANVGTWTLLARAVIPDARVEAFEPLAQHVSAFAAGCRHLAGVRLHDVALGSSNTVEVVRVTDFSDASSMLPLTATGQRMWGLREVEQVQVNLRRLDDYRREHDLPFPDLVKLDVQGYELEVLKSAVETIGPAKALITEVSFLDFYENQCSFGEICRFLESQNFALASLGATTVLGAKLKQTDVLFLKRQETLT